MYNIEAIALKIKEIRKKKKISQEKLAELVSMNTRSILRLENAQCIPTIDTLYKIANVLEVNISDLFEENIPQTKKEIIEDINKILNEMEEKELKSFYKAIRNFIN